MPFSGRGTKIVEYLIAHTRAVTKGSTFLNFIKHFIDHLPWNLKVLVHHPWKREHCHFKSQYGRSIAALPPFLGTLINTLSHVLSHQPMQVWLNNSETEGNTTLFISRAQSYIKVHDWQQKGQFSLLLSTSPYLNVICSENKFSCIKWLSQLLLLHETAKLFCSEWWLRVGKNILVV